MTTYTKKFKEFIPEWNPESDDYIVGYRNLDDSEIRIPLLAVDNSITANKYIRKDIDDYANGIIRFNKGFTVSNKVMSTIYLQGLDGWMGTQKGDFEMNSLILREFLEVPELRKNKITVMGNQFWFTDSAMVKVANATGSDNYDIYFKLEDEEYAPFELNDIIKGIYHYDNGFWTVYLKVYELIVNPDTGGEIGVKAHSMNGRDPRQSMLLARMNNSDNPERQGSIFADGLRKYIRVLDGYNPDDPTSEGSIKTLKVQIGDLSTITNHPIFGDLEGYGLYADNVYLTGKLIVKNDPNQPGQELGVYRGVWNNQANYYKYDQVTYKGSLFTSKQIDNIGHIPTGNVDDLWWELTVAKGEDGTSAESNVIIELTNDNHNIPTDSEGKNPSYGGAYCTAYVFQGTNDITDLYTISATVEAPVTSQQLQIVQNDNTVTITHISDDIDAAAIKFTATAVGYPTVTRTWNVAKVKSGTPGEPATAYWIVTDSPVIKKYVFNVNDSEVIRYEPSPFVVRAFAQTGQENIRQFDGYFRIKYGTQVNIVAGSVYQFTPQADVDNYTIEFFLEQGLYTLLDKEIITVVEDGGDGLQGPSIAFGGNWSSTTQYYGYADTQTCVYYGGKYYYTKTVSPDLSPLTIPSGAENNPASANGKVYWNEFVGQFDNIATGLLLAERIATSELTANKLFIVDRQESTGNIIAADGSIITKEEEKNLDPNQIIGRLTKGWYLDQGVIRSIAVNSDSTPKLILDKDGKITATGVNVTGTVHFENGTIGSLQVFNDSAWTATVNGPYPASSGFYYLRKNQGVTVTPQGHIIGKDYFLTGDSTVGPSVFVGDVYVPGSSVPGTDDSKLTSFLKLFNSLFERVLINSQYHIKAKLPLFSVGEITAYGGDNMDAPSIWDGIPVDKVTIDLVNGKLTVIGGTGGIKGISLPSMTAEDALVGASLNAAGDVITFTKGTFATKAYVTWGNITNKPSTFAPSSHTHNYASTVNVGSTSYNISGNTISLPAYPTVPSALKNPNALTISLNGTSQGAYDGSAAKSINITAASVGAAASSHSHNYLTLSGGTMTGNLTAPNYLRSDGATIWHSGNDGSGSGLDADTLDGNQGNYYTDYTNSAINNIQVGGRNLLLDTSYFKKWTNENNRWELVGIGTIESTNPVDMDGNGLISPPVTLPKGTYVLSFNATNLKVGSIRGNFANIPNVAGASTNIVTGKNVIHINVASAVNSKIVFYHSEGSSMRIDSIKLEKGNKPTDWTPAPEDIEIGGRNLILNSDFSNGREGWVIEPGGSTATVANSTLKMVPKIDSCRPYVGQYYEFEKDEIYTVSGRIESQTERAGTIFRIHAAKLPNAFQRAGVDIFYSGKLINGTFKATLKVTSTERRYLTFMLYADGAHGDTAYIKLSRIKLEKGNKATDWSPAPEDVDAEIALRPTTDQIKAEFTIDPTGISMLGKKIALTGMVTFTSLDASAQATINNKVTGNDIATKLGYSSYTDMINKAAAGKTIINGGYINTTLVKADDIVTKMLLCRDSDGNIVSAINREGDGAFRTYYANGQMQMEFRPTATNGVIASYSPTGLLNWKIGAGANFITDNIDSWDEVFLYPTTTTGSGVLNTTYLVGTKYLHYQAASGSPLSSYSGLTMKGTYSNSISPATVTVQMMITNGWYTYAGPPHMALTEVGQPSRYARTLMRYANGYIAERKEVVFDA